MVFERKKNDFSGLYEILSPDTLNSLYVKLHEDEKMLKDWIEIIRTCNTHRYNNPKDADLISRWLISTRACVFAMTLISGVIGVVLAILDRGIHGISWLNALLVLLGLSIAHAANNLINDYFDVLHKVDTQGYIRTEYAPHPILSGLMTAKKLLIYVFILDLLDFLIALYLSITKGWLIMGFAATGLALSVFYVAPPFKLKHHGLGEVAIFFIWGPLIIGGTYFALTGHITGKILLASIPYGVAIVAVVLGKHLDKRTMDEQRDVHTLPVILGDKWGRNAMIIAIILFYLGILFLCFVKILPWTSLFVLISLPQAIQVIKILRLPMPQGPSEAFKLAKPFIPESLLDVFNPEGKEHFPLWPLWFVVWGVWWVRYAGGWFVIGLIAGLMFK